MAYLFDMKRYYCHDLITEEHEVDEDDGEDKADEDASQLFLRLCICGLIFVVMY